MIVQFPDHTHANLDKAVKFKDLEQVQPQNQNMFSGASCTSIFLRKY